MIIDFLTNQMSEELSPERVQHYSEAEAFETFKRLRWPENNGNPICPKCGSKKHYKLNGGVKFRCASCSSDFTATSCTIFSGKKAPYTELLKAISLIVNNPKGITFSHISKELNMQYKSAFVLASKIRESFVAENLVKRSYWSRYWQKKHRVTDGIDAALQEGTEGE